MHRQTQHGVAKGVPGQEGDGEGGGDDPREYMTAFPAKAGPRPCPFEGCIVRVATRMTMRMHFWHRHVQETVVILEEVNLPHLRCPLLDILMP